MNRNKHLRSSSSLSQSQTQQSQSKSQSQPFSQSSGSVGDFEEVVNNIVSFLLVHNSTLHPIKKTELLRLFAPPNCKGKASANLIAEVKKKLQNVYGLDLLETDLQKYIVVNVGNDKLMANELDILDGIEHNSIIQPDEIDNDELGESDIVTQKQKSEANSDQILLILILGAIFHEESTDISEGSLLGFLQKLHIDLKSKDAFFGDVTKKIQEFERQAYLKKSMVTENSERGAVKEAHYAWGPRATAEITKKSVFEFLTKVYHRDKESMPLHMKQLLEESEPSPS